MVIEADHIEPPFLAHIRSPIHPDVASYTVLSIEAGSHHVQPHVQTPCALNVRQGLV